FKILLFVFKSLNALAPPYLTDLSCPHTSSRSRKSPDQMLLVIPRSRFKLKGDRAFAVAAPKLWNSYIRTVTSMFKSLLKTYLFSLAFPNQPDI
ncbi:hypothetical protein LDENG_00041770, partial [Lucifuga dentata]